MNANQLEDRLIDFGVRVPTCVVVYRPKSSLMLNTLPDSYYEQEPTLDFIIQKQERPNRQRISITS